MPRQRHRQHGNPFSIRGPSPAIDLVQLFGREAPIALDIGFGAGAFLLDLGRLHPEWNVLGLEIRQHLIDSAQQRAVELSLTNVRVVLANANLHLADLLPAGVVAFAAINFPDPWYKKRHQKRRVVRPEWARVLASKLRPGAEVHAVSDYEPVALEMRAVFQSTAGLRNMDGVDTFATETTTGIQTERERSHHARGHAIYRLRFAFEPCDPPVVHPTGSR